MCGVMMLRCVSVCITSVYLVKLNKKKLLHNNKLHKRERSNERRKWLGFVLLLFLVHLITINEKKEKKPSGVFCGAGFFYHNDPGWVELHRSLSLSPLSLPLLLFPCLRIKKNEK